MSLPWLIAPIPAATAAPAPPLDPPGVTAGSHGLSVRPCRSFFVNQRIENGGAFVRPTKIAPAARRWATTAASPVGISSANETMPLSVGCPSWSVLILVVTGTPCSRPSASPRRCAASAASAATSASSSIVRTTALIAGFTSCSRSRTDSVASRAVTRPARMRAASPTASSCQSAAFSLSDTIASLLGTSAERIRARPSAAA